jgi:threonyl-tRNA synthetase
MDTDGHRWTQMKCEIHGLMGLRYMTVRDSALFVTWLSKP